MGSGDLASLIALLSNELALMRCVSPYLYTLHLVGRQGMCREEQHCVPCPCGLACSHACMAPPSKMAWTALVAPIPDIQMRTTCHLSRPRHATYWRTKPCFG